MNISEFYNPNMGPCGPSGPETPPAPGVRSVDLFAPNPALQKKLYVVDDFYQNPDLVRDYALQVQYIEDNRWYKGNRSEHNYLTPAVKASFEAITGQPITRWSEYETNGKFQYCTPEDLLVYHCDLQNWAAMIYLTPGAAYDTGTSFYAHRGTGIRSSREPDSDQVFSGGFYDRTRFELVDTVGNVYNRLVIFDSRCIHAAAGYFGTELKNSRLFQIFFWD